jgi:plasmid stabilization system protein ParE
VKRFDVTAGALADVLEIWDFIAEDNLEAADRVLDEFNQAFRKLTEVPGLGHLRQDLTKRNLFFWPVRSYLVIYQKTDPLLVLAVLHGKRNVRKILKGR